MFPEISSEQLIAWGLRDPQQAEQELQILTDSGLAPSVLNRILDSFDQSLPLTPDPDNVLGDYIKLLQKLSPIYCSPDESAVTNDVWLNLINLFSMSRPLRGYILQDPDIFPLLEQAQNSNSNHNS